MWWRQCHYVLCQCLYTDGALIMNTLKLVVYAIIKSIIQKLIDYTGTTPACFIVIKKTRERNLFQSFKISSYCLCDIQLKISSTIYLLNKFCRTKLVSFFILCCLSSSYTILKFYRYGPDIRIYSRTLKEIPKFFWFKKSLTWCVCSAKPAICRLDLAVVRATARLSTFCIQSSLLTTSLSSNKNPKSLSLIFKYSL